MPARNAYALLGLVIGASENEIRAAYARAVLARQERGLSAADPDLRWALTTLLDPELRSAHDATLGGDIQQRLEEMETADASGTVFGYALRGALWFVGGCIVTAATYAAAGPGDKYFIAWGAVLFGGFQLLRGLGVYLSSGVPRRAVHVATLGVLIAVGVATGGWVAATEFQGTQEAAGIDTWNAALAATKDDVARANALFEAFNKRTTWSAQDVADMREIATLAARTADTLSKAVTPARIAWYRDGLVGYYRKKAELATAFAALGSSVPTQRALDDLSSRWNANNDEYRKLDQRFDTEVGSAR